MIKYYLMPHPPIIVPEIGHGEEKKIIQTSQAMKKIAEEISISKPEVIVVITPHGVMFSDAIAISYETQIEGSLEKFRAKTVKFAKKIDLKLIDEIVKQSNQKHIPVIKTDSKMLSKYKRLFELDHGTMVVLYFVEKIFQDYQIVHITYSPLSDIELFSFGEIIKTSIKKLKRQAVIIASGDLSHHLTEDGPYPFNPKGKEFDELLINNLQKGETLNIFRMDKKLIEEAGECGLRSLKILLGTLGGNFQGELLSYEGPLGVGYGVMRFLENIEQTDFLSLLKNDQQNKIHMKLNNSDEHVKLARKSLEYYFINKKPMEVPTDVCDDLLNNRSGVFVSLKKFGNLRGCVGTFLPTTENIAKEIIQNALEAAFDDYRFNPLKESELPEIDISVDVLSKPIKAKKEELNPKIYGVIVSKGNRRGLLLPNLEGINTIDQQLKIACEKAAIAYDDQIEIQKFTVQRHHEVSNE